MNLFKIIFSWWNGQTLGTFLQTLVYGNMVGKDRYGNKYYQNKNDTKRWVIYNGIVDASTIPPEWHSWLHKIIKTTPDQVKFNNFNWQKEHKKNLTGTNQAYVPQHEKKLPYKRWQPK
ncbi:NADH-ubiquinone oxidoreductase subunit NDUFA12 family protein [Candidatus Pelagibacter sp. HIMB109]|uniref:NADH-ubiquinone oxidoreductase subunit NDUFA12 family protein n=1 Tax=Candidatus Pelagibacter sp. HIMB109 TaxID=3415412 RepID=UPI003F877122